MLSFLRRHEKLLLVLPFFVVLAGIALVLTFKSKPALPIEKPVPTAIGDVDNPAIRSSLLNSPVTGEIMAKYEYLQERALQEVGMPAEEIASYTQAHAALAKCISNSHEGKVLEACVQQTMQFLISSGAP